MERDVTEIEFKLKANFRFFLFSFFLSLQHNTHSFLNWYVVYEILFR